MHIMGYNQLSRPNKIVFLQYKQAIFMLQANAQSTCTNCKHWIELKPFKPVQHLLSSMTSIIVLRANDVSAHPIYSVHSIHRGTAKVQLLHSLHLLVVSLR